jgi:hypothetical protein
MSRVLNVTNHSIDLDGGRILAPGEEAKSIDINNPHNRVAIARGLAIEIKSEPAKKQSSQQAKTENTGEDENQ